MKVFGPDLEMLEEQGHARSSTCSKRVPRHRRTSRWSQELGQPSLTVDDRPRQDRALRPQRRRRQRPDRGGGRRRGRHAGGAGREALRSRGAPRAAVPRDAGADRQHPRRRRPAGSRFRCKELADIQVASGASFIYRQDNSRYIGVQYSVEGRDLAGAVQDAQRQVAAAGQAAAGLPRRSGAASTRSTPRRASSSSSILPLTLLLIFLLLFALYSNFKFPLITVLGVLLSGPIGGLLALRAHRHAVLGVVGHRLPGAVRRLGADRGGLHLLRERAAAGAGRASPRRPARRRCSGCGRS